MVTRPWLPKKKIVLQQGPLLYKGRVSDPSSHLRWLDDRRRDGTGENRLEFGWRVHPDRRPVATLIAGT